jgi:hypothetical protein
MHYHWRNILSITRATDSNALRWLVHLPSCVDEAHFVILPGFQGGLSLVMNLQSVTSLRVQDQHSTALLRTGRPLIATTFIVMNREGFAAQKKLDF